MSQLVAERGGPASLGGLDDCTRASASTPPHRPAWATSTPGLVQGALSASALASSGRSVTPRVRA
jgi:hypothetical protein